MVTYSSSTSGEIGKPNFSYEVANQTFKSTSSSVMGLNEWIHLVGVRESTHTKLFMNGSLVSQNVGSSGSVNETGRNLYFGKYRDSNSIFLIFQSMMHAFTTGHYLHPKCLLCISLKNQFISAQVLLFRFSKISRQARKLVIFLLLNQNPNSSILFELVDGNGSDSNHEFSLDQNGTLRTAVEFDYEGGEF